jgi:hypothetical protein
MCIAKNKNQIEKSTNQKAKENTFLHLGPMQKKLIKDNNR